MKIIPFPEVRIKIASGLEGCVRPGFQAHSGVGAAPGLFDNVREDAFRDALSQMLGRRAHRLDFRVPGVELLKRSTTKQLIALPRGPEGDFRLAQCIEVECMHALRRRVLVHAPQMLAQKFLYCGTRQIVDFDEHE